MATEIEIKYKASKEKVDEIRRKLSQFNSKGRKYEKNIMFDNEHRVLDTVDARLRLRLISEKKDDENKHIEFTYKRRLSTKGGVKKEEEIEVEFDTDPKIFIQILNKIGFKRTTSYERFRETLISSNVKVTLDEFPYGFLIEIEGLEEDIQSISSSLGLDKESAYSLSCDDLYGELCRRDGLAIKKDISFDDPEMPKL